MTLGNRPRPGSADPIDWRLVDRYIAGECDDREIALVERWLAAHPEEGAFIESYFQELGISAPAPTASDAIRSLEVFRGRLQERVSPLAAPLALVRDTESLTPPSV